jgi:hypothetical protein
MLDPIDSDDSPHVMYDCVSYVIVRAESEDEARKLAAKVAKDETPECWLNPKWSECTEYTFPTADGESEVVWIEHIPT